MVCLRLLSFVHVLLLARIDSSKEACGQLDITYCDVTPPSLLTSKEPFLSMDIGREFSLNLNMRNMWSLTCGAGG